MVSAAATSAAALSHGSHAQYQALVAVGLDPAGHQLGDRGQPPGPCCRFHPGRLLDRRDDRIVVRHPRSSSNIHAIIVGSTDSNLFGRVAACGWNPDCG